MFGLVDDMCKSANRFYVSNFQDKARQTGIDLLLGVNPKSNSAPLLSNTVRTLMLSELNAQTHKYSLFEKKTVFVGSYNLNGKLPGKESLESWLFSNNVAKYDLIMIGVQELIQLNPGAYITTDTDKLRLIWENAIMLELNNQRREPVLLLRSVNLVALGMFAFVSSSEVHNIKSLEVCQIKTGLLGMAANKGCFHLILGGIGISLKFKDTSLAFVTAHFAAGNDAVEERNRDYWTITNGMIFKGRPLSNHE
jgi:hypothetical protein